MGKREVIIAKAQKHWAAVFNSSFRYFKSKDLVFQNIVECYGDKCRHYHTLQHIVSMLDELQEIETLFNKDDLFLLRWSIWFHDIVYDTKAKDNQERSAKVAGDALKQISSSLHQDFNEKITSLILATNHTEQPADFLCQILVDIDLSILGKPRKIYSLFEDNIRKEYVWVPEYIFCEERMKVLKSFADRESVYSTDIFESKYEKRAIENLEYSTEKLYLRSVELIAIKNSLVK